MTRTVLALALAAALPCAAAAAEGFSPLTEKSREYPLLSRIMPGSLEGLQSRVVDIDGDGTAEIVAKLDCPDARDVCRTVVLSYSGDSWGKVFDATTGDISFEKPKFGSMRDIRSADGVWKWNGVRYAFDAASSGDPATFQKAPAQYQGLLASQFGQGAALLVGASKAHVEIAPVKPSKDAQAVIARLVGDGVCGLRYGCPTRMLTVENGGYRTLLSTGGQGAVSLSRSDRAGWRDVAVERPGGAVALFGWNGKSYASAGK